MTDLELIERVDLAAARSRVALEDIEERGGRDTTTHLGVLRSWLVRPRHRAPDRSERALAAIRAGGVDAGEVLGLSSRSRRELLHDLTLLDHVLARSARVGVGVARQADPPVSCPRADG